MRSEPPIKRTVAFIDGQNLFHSARSAFGYTYPNYDVTALANAACASRGKWDYPNLTVKKIPRQVLSRCAWGTTTTACRWRTCPRHRPPSPPTPLLRFQCSLVPEGEGRE